MLSEKAVQRLAERTVTLKLAEKKSKKRCPTARKARKNDRERKNARGRAVWRVMADDPELMKYQQECLDKLFEYNSCARHETEKKAALLKEMFAEIGEDCYIETPFHANFGGAHVHFGKNVYANFNLTLVDDTHIYVGDYTMFGPNVTLATAGHPVLPELRENFISSICPFISAKLLARRGRYRSAGGQHRR